MKKMFLLFPLLILIGCASSPVQYPEQMGTACLQLSDKEIQDKEHECLRFQSFRDAHKWHRVRDWQEWGDMPELP